ncbi:pyrroloquinoline quinone-dependent dehydrogenase [Sphingomonas quercus]|uniref:Pyrroloquinoline quinone-dependent dehydrogenase n=1 Tax=Sphingomonas quercus TaxID=2842451 RepID=A0ABS6BGE0_9SPHN|nr:pyrroloquinoline quinone-dependent dehydrogenase [Sphingomonas quercus]MBU3077360.1 pyrroloquinoline quinone-dependent dehydrogenase [Sphingomonas quercus]
MPVPPRRRRLPLALLLVAGVAMSGAAGARGGSGANYDSYGGDQGGTRYSTLKKITRSNVAGLTQAWRVDMPAGALEVQPIVVDGILYTTTTNGAAMAIDAATGKTRWSVSYPGVGGGRGRGLTFWRSGNDRRLLVPAGGFVYALNADDGQLVSSFGDGGKVNLRLQLRGDDPQKNMVSIGTPPSLYKDVFITAGGVPEVSPSAPGDIRGWDVRTGKLLWSFHAIPHPGEVGYETWPQDAWKTAGGVNAWQGTIVDQKHGIVFAALGSPADDFWGGERLGDNLFGNSLVAIDATTGKRLWHFQTVHHDMWDADFAAQPILMTVRRNGRRIEAVAVTNKAGFIYIFDRRSGKPLFDVKETPFPPSDVEGEVASKTQPIPVLPAPLGLQKIGPELLTNRTPEANAAAREKLATMKYGGVFTPIAKDKDTIVIPGFSGGVEWGGMAADPKGILYANSEDIAWYTSIIDQNRPGAGRSKMNFSGYNKFRDADGYPATLPPWGTLSAIDMNTGQYKWKIPFGYYPELAAKGMKDTGTESYGGPLVTASGLLFIGATIYDQKMRAFDTATGKLLWEADLPFAGNASPATYVAGGEQYVVIAASGGRNIKGPKGASLIAFKLPK